MSARTPSLALLRALPKVDLHRHLEGAFRIETLWDFHCRNRQRLHASFAALQAACTVPPGQRPGFRGFLARFSGLRFRYGGPDAIERLAAEAVADAAADGVAHLELRFSPPFAARRMKEPLPPDTAGSAVDTLAEVELAADAVVRGARREAARLGISVAFVVTLNRNYSLAVNRPAVQLLMRPVGAALSGLDLAGDETLPARFFADFFRQWKAAGRGITIHAGEDARAGGADNVRQALTQFGADRIGHGVRAWEDGRLVAALANKRVTLELCPTSNVQTRACPSFRAHPLKALLAAGVPATINTDDPATSRTTLSREYLRAAVNCGLGWSALRSCALHAAHAAFLSPAARDALAERLSAAWPVTL
ncbi:MAG: adenosine deaminase [Planctomycetota bacterium]|nr:adenosine deaminase [Planctomycetota bacterium]